MGAKKQHFFFSTIILNIAFFWVLFVYLFALDIIFNCNKLSSIFVSDSNVSFNVPAFCVSIIYLCLTFICVSTIMVFVPTSQLSRIMLSSVVYLVTIIFSGNIIPNYLLNNLLFLNIFSYISPFRYTTSMCYMSVFNSTSMIGHGGIWNPNNYFWFPLELDGSVWASMYSQADIWVDWFFPYIFMLIALLWIFLPERIKLWKNQKK
jgi:hypothetical protein